MNVIKMTICKNDEFICLPISSSWFEYDFEIQSTQALPFSNIKLITRKAQIIALLRLPISHVFCETSTSYRGFADISLC